MERKITGHDLPYGGVMATAGSAIIAQMIGWPQIILPLLIIAIIQAILIPAHRIRKAGGIIDDWRKVHTPENQVGFHTVPLGLAVITSVLLTDPIRSYPINIQPFALFFLAISAVLLLWLLIRFVISVFRFGFILKLVDGAWFIVPAGIFGTCIAAIHYLDFAKLQNSFLLLIIRIAMAISLILFWIFSFLSAKRILRYGLKGSPPPFWWIWMGCAGLAAAAISIFMQSSIPLSQTSYAIWSAFLYAAESIAVIVGIPVFAMSAYFLLKQCKFRDKATWQTTFSTAVFAMGTFEVGKLSGSALTSDIGILLGYLTLIFWTCTVVWNFARKFILRPV